MDLNKLKCFYESALQGNYAHAGKTLGKTSAAIGQSVRDLEKSLDCALFRRTYRGLTLTKEGQTLLESATKIFKEANQVANLIKSSKTDTVRLKMLATVGITSDWVSRFLPSFVDKNPQINFEISSLTTMAVFDVNQYDVYIGEILKKDPKYIYKHIKNFRYNFYASREYVQKYGLPQTSDDLKKHRLIEFNIKRVSGFYKSTDFFETANGEGRQTIAIDSTIGEFQLAKAGLGIACLCEELSYLKDSNLLPVLSEIGPIDIETYFVYPEILREDKTVKALLKEVRSHACNTK